MGEECYDSVIVSSFETGEITVDEYLGKTRVLSGTAIYAG
jgi:hypothetical protein